MLFLLYTDLEINKTNMKAKFYHLISIIIVFFSNCKKVNVDNEERQPILKQIDMINIQGLDSKTSETYDYYQYFNDTVFCHQTNLYINGVKNQFVDTEKAVDSVINLYNLKKMKIEYKKEYKDHFEYEDCILKRKIKMDSGIVHTLLAKNGAIFQIINIKNKPTLLQVYSQNKTYKERIISMLDRNTEKSFGNGFSNAMLYDIDKDGIQELIVINNNLDKNYIYGDVYKINLPK